MTDTGKTPFWRRLRCFVGLHEWRSYEEARRDGTFEACKHCVGWRFAPAQKPEAPQ